MQHARLRVADASTQSVQSVGLIVLALPEDSLARLGVSSVASPPEHVQLSDDILVELEKLASCVPGMEVVAPTSEHRVQVMHQHSHVLHSTSPRVG